MTDKPVLNAYRLYHRLLGYSRDVRAPSAQEACEKLGWLIGDVWVRCVDPADHPAPWKGVPLKHLEHTLKEERSHG